MCFLFCCDVCVCACIHLFKNKSATEGGVVFATTVVVSHFSIQEIAWKGWKAKHPPKARHRTTDLARLTMRTEIIFTNAVLAKLLHSTVQSGQELAKHFQYALSVCQRLAT